MSGTNYSQPLHPFPNSTFQNEQKYVSKKKNRIEIPQSFLMKGNPFKVWHIGFLGFGLEKNNG